MRQSGRGAGSIHVENRSLLPRGLAATAICVPSGEMPSPPITAPRPISRSLAAAVRLTASPPAMNLTQTLAAPPASDRYATHLPSGDIAGAPSRSVPVVRRTTCENEGAAGPDRRGNAIVATAAINRTANSPMPANCRLETDGRTGGSASDPASCNSNRASAASRNRCRGSFSRQRFNNRRTDAGVEAGKRDQSTSRSRTAAIVSVVVARAKIARPVSSS